MELTADTLGIWNELQCLHETGGEGTNTEIKVSLGTFYNYRLS